MKILATLLQDARYCLRGFARRPLLATVVVATLAFGIGINAAIYSIFDQLLLRELDVEAPQELVNLSAPGARLGMVTCFSNDAGTCDETFSYPMFRDLERVEGPFVGIAAHRYVEASLAFDGITASGNAALVSGSYFPVLGVLPAAGRLLDTQDDRIDGEAGVVVLAYSYWRAGFAADPGVVGRDLVVNGRALTIVGVAPRGFYGTTVGERPLVFLPITFRWLTSPRALPNHTDRQSYWAYLFARVKPGVSLQQAQAAINAPFRAILNDADVPLLAGATEQQLSEFRTKSIVLAPGARGQSRIDDRSKTPLSILLVSTALVLLIACVNVANLMLARGLARGGEIAVRVSLGASRARLLALLLVEALLLAAAAALVSLPLTLGALRGIHSLLPASATTVIDFRLGGTVLTITAALAVLSSLVFGLIPALKFVRRDVSGAVGSQSSRQTGGKPAARFRSTLTTSQIALSLALIVLAGWFVQSVTNIARVDLGFNPESLIVFSIAPERNGYAQARSSALFSRLEEELKELPGVESAAFASVPLLDSSNWGGDIVVEGYDVAPGADVNASFNAVSATFFRTVEMPVVGGAGFARSGRDDPKTAVVNERFVEKFGLGAGAVGKRIALGYGNPPDITIVGVVRDAKYSEVKQEIPAQVFTPSEQAPFVGAASFYLRTGVAPLEMRNAVERVLARNDPALPILEFRTVVEQVRENVFLDRFMVTLAVALALIATVLAAIGIYGVLSYGVAQRLREIGLRMALGAAPKSIRRMVLAQIGWMAAVGMAIGVTLALLLGSVARALFFGLAPTDPLVPGVAVLSLTVVVLVAGYWPARRAALVDPVTALRAD